MLRLQHVVIFIVALSMFELAFACKCTPTRPPLDETFNASTAVFVGTALSVKTDEEIRERRIIFKPSEIFKGGHCLHRRFKIYTRLDSAACGVYVNEGEKWQIWATGTKDRLEIQSCGRSTQSVDDDIEWLRAHRSP